MTAARIIEEIERLSEAEQAKVVDYVRQLDQTHPLSGKELRELAEKMVESRDAKEVAALKRKITQGFYGGEGHA